MSAAKRQKLSTTSTSTFQPNNINHQTSKDSTAMDLSEAARKSSAVGNVREEEVGILQYVNTSNPGFSGILKQRYTDFLVNEIMEDGTVVHLTDTSLPKPVKVQQKVKPEPVTAAPPAQVLEKDEPTEKEQGVVQNTVADSHAKVEESPAATEDTNMANASDVKVEQNGEATEETKTDNNNVKVEAVKEVAQDVKVGASGEVSQDIKTEVNELSGDTAEKSPVGDDDHKLLTTYFGADVRDQILALYKKVLQRPDGKAGSYGIVMTEPIKDRELRTQIHKNCRRIFNSKFETSVNDDGTMKVSVAGKSQRGGRQENSYHTRGPPDRSQMKGKLGWAELGGEHLHFSLLKENKDTMEVISFLAGAMRCPAKSFAFAGTKDRRGVTVQRISLFRGDAKKLIGLNRDLRGSKIGGLKYEKNGLSLGDLQGNEFVITLRDCHFTEEEGSLDEAARVAAATEVVGQAVKNMSEHGFLNYYGLQRFGSFSTGTHEVGRFILKGDFRNAVQALLTYNPEIMDVDAEMDNSKFSRDDIARAIAINLFETKENNNEAALRKMPRKFSAEIAILRWLKGNRQNDYIGALTSINRGLKLMYVHAYQSLVWNRAVSERWARFGNKVIEGDLVLVDSKDVVEGNLKGDAQAEEVDESGEVIVKPALDDIAVSLDDQFQRARPLSKEEASSGKYSIFDIVLPTPGFDVEYPPNEIGEFYKEFMASEAGGGLDPLNMRRPQKDFSLSGSYRKMMATAKDVSFEVKLYSDMKEQLVETDLDRFYKGKTRPQPPQRFPQRFPQQQTQQRLPQDNPWANFKGLAESDKAISDEVKAQIAAAALETPKEKPKIQESFIETSAETGKRTGHRDTVVKELKPLTVQDGQTSVAEVNKLNAPEDIPLPATPQPESRIDSHILKRSADQMDSEISGVDKAEKKDAEEETHAEVTVGNEMVVDTPPEPKKIAVVVTFKLGSSQYATMALRELMKSGGVQEYKTGFAGR